jgi:multidrug efflux pump
MERTAAEELPDYAQLDYKGQSREYRTAGGAVLFTFAMALLIVYLVLAAQFESFIHPLVIMLTVPHRHRHAGRPRRQERHPDRGLRQPAP